MYGKIFASLYQGTLRGRAHEILVFTNMIACADQVGIVDKHPRAIAEEIGLPIEATRDAIAALEAPDPESRSLDHGGARIVRAFDGRAWGWQIVNYAKYRAIRNEEDRREANRLAQQRFRNKSKQTVMDRNQSKPPSAMVSHGKPKEKDREMDREMDKQKEENTPTRQARRRAQAVAVVDNPPTVDEVQAFVDEIGGTIDAQEFLDENARRGWTYGKAGNLVRDWRAHYRQWMRRRAQDEPQGPTEAEHEAERQRQLAILREVQAEKE